MVYTRRTQTVKAEVGGRTVLVGTFRELPVHPSGKGEKLLLDKTEKLFYLNPDKAVELVVIGGFTGSPPVYSAPRDRHVDYGDFGGFNIIGRLVARRFNNANYTITQL